jgi:hypothetical protein
LRDTCFHGGLPSRILALRSGQHLPQDHFVHFLGFNSRIFERSFDCDRTKIVRGHRGKCTIETPDRGAGGTDDDDIIRHGVSPLLLKI